ncbi:hypothetical protein FAUST_3716 [Fusarium austroamericanum]|uniref:Uncharacterized protein n=1 Tax=Fusarium austroamericanum TaxID=282268 RepID=A0AAN6C4F9_FUSAU|nr:hypothetical protein FAUST_3716 [Fusarium austroamericanum]
MPPKQPRKRKPVASQTSSQHRHRAASAIPSTPISQPMSSSQVAKKCRVSDGNERIAETPQENKRRAMGSKGQQTPERTTQLAQATSPSTPFEVSSAESSDSDCQIKKVLPSPKRKLVAASLRGRPAKRARMERSITPSPADESDCVIEKVLPSPKRRQVEQKKRNIKRRRVGDCSDSPVCIESDVDSGAEDVNSLPEPTQTQTPEELREHSPSIVDALLAWLDGPQSGGAASEAAQPTSPPAIASTPPNAPFSTAPEQPIQESPSMETPSREGQTQEVQVEKAQVEDASTSPASDLENIAPSSTYKLQPVYSGENLQESHTPGTPTHFRPHHRDSLVGLTSILKRSSEKPLREINPEVDISFPDISPLSRDGRDASSPTERIQDSKHQAKIIQDETSSTPPPPVSFPRRLTLADLRSKDWKSSQPRNIYRPLTPLPKPSQWLRQRKILEPLTSIIDETAAEDAASDQGTPSKPPTERVNRTQKLINAEPQSSDEDDSGDERSCRVEEWLKSEIIKQETPPKLPTQPVMRQTQKSVAPKEQCATDVRVTKTKHHKLKKQLKQSTERQFARSTSLSRKTRSPNRVSDQDDTHTEESEGECQKRLEEEQLVPVPNRNWTKPSFPNQEIMPQVIRDGVSEHAIKPTVATFEKKSAAGHGFTFEDNDSNQKYNWDVDWSASPSLGKRETRAVASELKHRGIKTERQYSNFWYNLTMKLSSIAGSPVPLFTAKKKALETFVEEAMRNADDRRKRKARKNAAKNKPHKREKKKHKTKDRRQGVEEAFLDASDTNKEKCQKKSKKLPQGVDAFLIPGDTDEEGKSSSEESDSDYDGEDLMAKVRADIDRQRRMSGGGTSCGYRKGDL